MKRIKQHDVVVCTEALRKALGENYDNYDAACYQMTGIIKHLLRSYDGETIKMAFELAAKNLLESKATRSKAMSKAALTEAMKLVEDTNVKLQVTTEEELSRYLAAGVTVYAMGTGPFGEDEGAVVDYFGDAADSNIMRVIEVDDEVLSEMNYQSIKDFCEDMAGTKVIVLDTTIGQSDNNFYALDAYSIRDCDLYIVAIGDSSVGM